MRRLWLRWPSRDHRDYQTSGRDAQPRSVAPLRLQQADTRGAPQLSMIASIHRQDACLLVEVVMCRPPGHDRAPDRGRVTIGAADSDTTRGPIALPVHKAETITVTLMLN